MVLADTSVWVAHFKNASGSLIALLGAGRVLMHPMVVAELACGTPPERARTLKDLGMLPLVHQASLSEAMVLVESEKLYGRGCGLVDIVLLASTLLTPGALIWTMDKRQAELAAPLGILHRPALH